MAKSSELPDSVLIKRARHGGRNLAVLAVLATICAVVGVAAAFYEPSAGLWLAAGSFVAVAASYWMLATAARRGDERGILAFVLACAAFIALNLAAQAWSYFQSEGEAQPRVFWIAIPLLVLWVFARNRADLLEARRRGLLEQAFPQARPSGRLALAGGVSLFFGCLALVASLLLPAISAARSAAENAAARRAFVAMIENEEQSFLAAVKAAEGQADSAAMDALMPLLGALQSQASEIAVTAPSNPRLRDVLNQYGEVLAMWARGFAFIRENGSADQATVDLLTEADRRRLEILKEFDALARPMNSGAGR